MGAAFFYLRIDPTADNEKRQANDDPYFFLTGKALKVTASGNPSTSAASKLRRRAAGAMSAYLA